MKIVILDAFAVNPGDLSWDFLKKYGELAVYDRTERSEVISRCAGADIVLSNRSAVSRELLEACPTVKFINTLGTGYDMIDLEACRERGVIVCNVPAYSSDSVAQLAFMLIMNLTTDIAALCGSVREGKWTGMADFMYREIPYAELAGVKLGLIGCGGIGRRVAEMAAAFKMEVYATTRSRKTGSERGITYMTLDKLLPACEVVSIHCPLNEDTKGMVDESFISKMKDGAVLINTARGAIVNERAVADALNAGKLAGAGLDVLAVEPPLPDNPLLGAKNCLITPHIGWATVAARKRLLNTLEQNLSAFFAGAELRNRIV